MCNGRIIPGGALPRARDAASDGAGDDGAREGCGCVADASRGLGCPKQHVPAQLRQRRRHHRRGCPAAQLPALLRWLLPIPPALVHRTRHVALQRAALPISVSPAQLHVHAHTQTHNTQEHAHTGAHRAALFERVQFTLNQMTHSNSPCLGSRGQARPRTSPCTG